MRIAAGFVMIVLFASCAKEIKRNLEGWQGEWVISTAIEGETSWYNEFTSQQWKDAEITNDNFGTLVIDKDGNATLHFQNDVFSDTLVMPYTAKGYLHDYGQHHLEFYGMKVTESSDPDLAVGKEIGNDGNVVFWLRENSGKERVVELDGSYSSYGFYNSPTARWMILTKK